MQNKPLIIENIYKRFGKVQALNGVSLRLSQGEIYGLIGPDGAGKTTLMRIAVSLMKPDKGHIYFQGQELTKDVSFVRSQVGYMPQRFSLYPDLTVEENLRFFGDLFGIPNQLQNERMKRLYRFSKLEPFKHRRAADLSGGMKQKLALSCMLMHEPKIIVMDEPTYGVDPVSRSELWGTLKALAAEGRTILVSTSYMDEAQLCDRVGLIFKGKMLADGTAKTIADKVKASMWRIKTARAFDAYSLLIRFFPADDCHVFGNAVHVLDSEKKGRAFIKKVLKDGNVPFDSIAPDKPNIEDAFLKLIKIEGDGPNAQQQ